MSKPESTKTVWFVDERKQVVRSGQVVAEEIGYVLVNRKGRMMKIYKSFDSREDATNYLVNTLLARFSSKDVLSGASEKHTMLPSQRLMMNDRMRWRQEWCR